RLHRSDRRRQDSLRPRRPRSETRWQRGRPSGRYLGPLRLPTLRGEAGTTSAVPPPEQTLAILHSADGNVPATLRRDVHPGREDVWKFAAMEVAVFEQSVAQVAGVDTTVL